MVYHWKAPHLGLSSKHELNRMCRRAAVKRLKSQKEAKANSTNQSSGMILGGQQGSAKLLKLSCVPDGQKLNPII